jgi:hypothetical protein
MKMDGMKLDLLVKALLIIIAVLLGVIALRPLSPRLQSMPRLPKDFRSTSNPAFRCSAPRWQPPGVRQGSG